LMLLALAVQCRSHCRSPAHDKTWPENAGSIVRTRGTGLLRCLTSSI